MSDKLCQFVPSTRGRIEGGGLVSLSPCGNFLAVSGVTGNIQVIDTVNRALLCEWNVLDQAAPPKSSNLAKQPSMQPMVLSLSWCALGLVSVAPYEECIRIWQFGSRMHPELRLAPTRAGDQPILVAQHIVVADLKFLCAAAGHLTAPLVAVVGWDGVVVYHYRPRAELAVPPEEDDLCGRFLPLNVLQVRWPETFRSFATPIFTADALIFVAPALHSTQPPIPVEYLCGPHPTPSVKAVSTFRSAPLLRAHAFASVVCGVSVYALLHRALLSRGMAGDVGGEVLSGGWPRGTCWRCYPIGWECSEFTAHTWTHTSILTGGGAWGMADDSCAAVAPQDAAAVCGVGARCSEYVTLTRHKFCKKTSLALLYFGAAEVLKVSVCWQDQCARSAPGGTYDDQQAASPRTPTVRICCAMSRSSTSEPYGAVTLVPLGWFGGRRDAQLRTVAIASQQAARTMRTAATDDEPYVNAAPAVDALLSTVCGGEETHSAAGAHRPRTVQCDVRYMAALMASSQQRSLDSRSVVDAAGVRIASAIVGDGAVGSEGPPAGVSSGAAYVAARIAVLCDAVTAPLCQRDGACVVGVDMQGGVGGHGQQGGSCVACAPSRQVVAVSPLEPGAPGYMPRVAVVISSLARQDELGVFELPRAAVHTCRSVCDEGASSGGGSASGGDGADEHCSGAVGGGDVCMDAQLRGGTNDDDDDDSDDGDGDGDGDDASSDTTALSRCSVTSSTLEGIAGSVGEQIPTAAVVGRTFLDPAPESSAVCADPKLPYSVFVGYSTALLQTNTVVLQGFADVFGQNALYPPDPKQLPPEAFVRQAKAWADRCQRAHTQLFLLSQPLSDFGPLWLPWMPVAAGYAALPVDVVVASSRPSSCTQPTCVIDDTGTQWNPPPDDERGQLADLPHLSGTPCRPTRSVSVSAVVAAGAARTALREIRCALSALPDVKLPVCSVSNATAPHVQSVGEAVRLLVQLLANCGVGMRRKASLRDAEMTPPPACSIDGGGPDGTVDSTHEYYLSLPPSSDDVPGPPLYPFASHSSSEDAPSYPLAPFEFVEVGQHTASAWVAAFDMSARKQRSAAADTLAQDRFTELLQCAAGIFVCDAVGVDADAVQRAAAHVLQAVCTARLQTQCATRDVYAGGAGGVQAAAEAAMIGCASSRFSSLHRLTHQRLSVMRAFACVALAAAVRSYASSASAGCPEGDVEALAAASLHSAHAASWARSKAIAMRADDPRAPADCVRGAVADSSARPSEAVGEDHSEALVMTTAESVCRGAVRVQRGAGAGGCSDDSAPGGVGVAQQCHCTSCQPQVWDSGRWTAAPPAPLPFYATAACVPSTQRLPPSDSRASCTTSPLGVSSASTTEGSPLTASAHARLILSSAVHRVAVTSCAAAHLRRETSSSEAVHQTPSRNRSTRAQHAMSHSEQVLLGVVVSAASPGGQQHRSMHAFSPSEAADPSAATSHSPVGSASGGGGSPVALLPSQRCFSTECGVCIILDISHMHPSMPPSRLGCVLLPLSFAAAQHMSAQRRAHARGADRGRSSISADGEAVRCSTLSAPAVTIDTQWGGSDCNTTARTGPTAPLSGDECTAERAGAPHQSDIGFEHTASAQRVFVVAMEWSPVDAALLYTTTAGAAGVLELIPKASSGQSRCPPGDNSTPTAVGGLNVDARPAAAADGGPPINRSAATRVRLLSLPPVAHHAAGATFDVGGASQQPGGGGGPLFAAAWAPHGRTLAVGDAVGRVVVFAFPTLTFVACIATTGRPLRAVRALSFADEDGRTLLVAGADAKVSVWRLDLPDRTAPLLTMQRAAYATQTVKSSLGVIGPPCAGHRGISLPSPTLSVCSLRGGRGFVTAHADGSILAWDTLLGLPVRVMVNRALPPSLAQPLSDRVVVGVLGVGGAVRLLTSAAAASLSTVSPSVTGSRAPAHLRSLVHEAVSSVRSTERPLSEGRQFVDVLAAALRSRQVPPSWTRRLSRDVLNVPQDAPECAPSGPLPDDGDGDVSMAQRAPSRSGDADVEAVDDVASFRPSSGWWGTAVAQRVCAGPFDGDGLSGEDDVQCRTDVLPSSRAGGFVGVISVLRDRNAVEAAALRSSLAVAADTLSLESLTVRSGDDCTRHALNDRHRGVTEQRARLLVFDVDDGAPFYASAAVAVNAPEASIGCCISAALVPVRLDVSGQSCVGACDSGAAECARPTRGSCAVFATSHSNIVDLWWIARMNG